MKKILLILSCNALILITHAQQSYSLAGKIKGEKANGQTVSLWSDNGQKKIASSVIKNNSFQLSGTLNHPELVRFVIAPSEKSEQKFWKASAFYLDEGKLQLSGHIDSLPSYYYNPKAPNVKPIIEGSQTQSLANQLNRSINDEQQKLNKLDKDYMKEYHLPAIEGKFNTNRGIAILKEMEPYKKNIFEKKWNFIRNNAISRVALDEASYMVMGYGEESLSKVQMDELLDIFKPFWHGKKAFIDLQTAVAKAKATAIGSNILDGPILDIEGNKVELTAVFPKNKKFILLEFWASWCGPCRGEIPHLRHTYATWKDRGFDIVSISLDEKETDWKKAMTEENMVWNQYNAREGFNSQIAKSYDIQGIPYALLIDSNGTIIKHGMRGASLDQALEELIK
ncbi:MULTISPECIES: thioredoxin-like domain-containing protein [Sphingobacterium]|uniref:thioredoxin-like domain-containing protein n=1 Tax=Sphingobacterium TaxID=28453 RepID=UPI0025800B07|nr:MULTISPECIES: thioredoxin-like domain-containing protein [Sphingobacterium]